MPYELSITLLVMAAISALIARRKSAFGTTLAAPWWWAVGSLLLVAATEVIGNLAGLEPPARRAWQLISATATLCPGIALLGAKRPQDRAWSWIVASLWLILALPAIQQLVMNRSAAFEMHQARSWFMSAVLLFCMANSLLSRFWHAVLLAAGGQVVLLLPFLFPRLSIPHVDTAWGIAAITIAVIIASIRFRESRATAPMDRVWLDFRNQFGLVWSLRFMESFNAIARANHWNLYLVWSGFRDGEGNPHWQLPAEQMRVLKQALSNLLRRFVSNDWIADRLGEDP